MCRLAAITSNKYFSPMENILALETMKEGHDGSGLGLTLKGLGGEFKDLKRYPIMSGICSREGIKTLDDYMKKKRFKLKHVWTPKIKPAKGIAARDYYFARAYNYPAPYKNKSLAEKEDLLMKTRLALRRIGEPDESIFVFSFYPDVITLKEVGDPLELGEFFGLDRDGLKAKVIFAQGRQNTNYTIYLYACHPFFIQGYCSMTNGENTAFVPIREFLMSRGFPGYIGYNSDSEVFTHILHYSIRQLGLPLNYYKDIITPLKTSEIGLRRDSEALSLIKQSLRPLCIDGPNMVIGFTPDGTCFMVHDSKKLRPGVVAGVKGKYALMSEECGVDKAVPKRDKSMDIFPMKYDMVVVSPDAKEVKVWNQLQG
ncbi:MAG: glutamate synthase [Nitrospirae bacterium CG_4_10_14_3_um_filter_44_29]|nr:glutamate synthase [Nitrospirota bacterium]OIO27149.1 MAG: glutamate synthase [Nitrospirae bacterium CG1_02_44_142]PIV41582.1 MAG: glutamate synthase [Nitrospirae bacterium CG02_land_8_20_14_3_00_44_33]PIV66213.1 MAG: glutamate synthase [Nitrospirae bacterium CG01_land_8_20_14_3_00_44_22]PIW90010.1 MAG: glutamate synthase [Nitrospirae bacterium CG_4_8_14_3_um_filter_44_28]PIX89163.1 MAG: glutamate synthase [Nitrospirae bacterium CG_4_10_14_3_um_filter_44_29]PJA83547.1 MAG: glutamate syntha